MRPKGIITANVSSGAESIDHRSGLSLARACLHGDPGAIRELERLLEVNVRLFVARIDGSPSFVGEVRDNLRERLLDPEQPRLARYEGTGPLLGWLRVVAIRVALDIKRSQYVTPATIDSDIVECLADSAGDPEVMAIKTEYRAAFERALTAAVAQLTARQRAVLRLYLLGQMNIDEIGKIYGVHRATVARWISTAQTAVLDAARAYLCKHHRLTTTELHSLARMLRSELHISLDRLLAS
jgi:RNA polymerase sigma-70 factor (ECF subfamily)